MYEEELFRQCADEADALQKRIKQIYSVSESFIVFFFIFILAFRFVIFHRQIIFRVES